MIPTFASVQAQAKVEGLVQPTPTVLLLFCGTYQHNQWETDGGLGDEKAKITENWSHGHSDRIEFRFV